jgi:hypothetical protein
MTADESRASETRKTHWRKTHRLFLLGKSSQSLAASLAAPKKTERPVQPVAKRL